MNPQYMPQFGAQKPPPNELNQNYNIPTNSVPMQFPPPPKTTQSKPPNGPSFNQNPLLNVQNGPSANFFPQPVANSQNGGNQPPSHLGGQPQFSSKPPMSNPPQEPVSNQASLGKQSPQPPLGTKSPPPNQPHLSSKQSPLGGASQQVPFPPQNPPPSQFPPPSQQSQFPPQNQQSQFNQFSLQNQQLQFPPQSQPPQSSQQGSVATQSLPPPPNQQQLPPPRQPPVSSQQVPFAGQPPQSVLAGTPNQQPVLGSQQSLLGQPPLLAGQQPLLGGPPPPLSGGQRPPLADQQPPLGPQPLLGGQQPPFTNRPPPLLNQQPPVAALNHQPPLGGPQSNQPSSFGGLNQFPPPSSIMAQPPLPTKQAPFPGVQPPQPQFPGQFPPQNQQAPFAGPPLPANQLSFSNQQSTFAGQPPPLGNQPPHALGNQPPPLGNQPPPFANQPPPKQPPFNQQPLSGNRPPLPGQPPAQFPNQPPPPLGQNQPPMYAGVNQMSNQMQDMNLRGPRQYPGGALPQPGVNGDNGPHMPPPGYLNGQQARMPPGGYPQPNFQAQAQQRRLDPDQMPSPIQVIQDDQKTRSGIFYTNQRGLVPPLVTTKFIVHDQGHASPRFMRSTMYNVPTTNDLMKQAAVPFGLVISPMARTVDQEYPPPIVNFGDLGPVRCVRCKAYMCPYMQFIDSGRRFQCMFCKAATEVPAEYFQHLDHTGQRMDRYERPELVLGTYEFTATKDYCRNNTAPNPPAVIFVIDVSYNNIKSGLVHLLCSQIKTIIKELPIDQECEKSNMRVGFITYNSTVHFYNIKGTLAAPQMMVVGDVQDMFMPLLDGFLCTPEESDAVIDSLMEQIPTMFGDTRETEIVLLPAILAGLEALKASECAGKLLVFHSSLPIAEAPGKLKNRDDRKLLGTEKERTVLTPQNQAYNQLGQDCVGVGCSVDLFLFNNAYIDVATLGQVCRLTGGEVYKYTYFQADVDGERLIQDVITNISRPIAFDAIMRVRTSTGVRPTDFYGHFFMSNTTDMEMSAVDCDKAIAVEIKHDDKLIEEEGVYIQVALLYTSCSGQRRLRIINQSLKTCSQMADLYRSCDLDTLINFFGKQSAYKLLENNPKAVKDALVSRSAQILANYRKNCASPSSAGQLILPECMKLLPLYVNCLLKSDALSGGSDMTLDDRSFVMQAIMTMDVPNSVNYFYPRLIPLHEIQPPADDGTPLDVPQPVRCSVEKISDQGVYVLENGIHMLLWVGLGASSEFCKQVFGVPSPMQIDVDKTKIPAFDNPLSLAVVTAIEQIRSERHRYMRMTIIRQNEKLEPIFKHFLVEDRSLDGSPSYVDFLCHMHKEIRTILS